MIALQGVMSRSGNSGHGPTDYANGSDSDCLPTAWDSEAASEIALRTRPGLTGISARVHSYDAIGST